MCRHSLNNPGGSYFQVAKAGPSNKRKYTSLTRRAPDPPTRRYGRRANICRPWRRGRQRFSIEFATDSLLEGDGFELQVPRQIGNALLIGDESDAMLFKADDGVGDVRGFQGGDFLGGQLHVDRSDCIVEMMQLGGTDDRSGDDWFRQEPGERNLCGSHAVSCGDRS